MNAGHHSQTDHVVWVQLGAKTSIPVIARPTLLDRVARSARHGEVPTAFPVIWWQVVYIPQHAYIYCNKHTAVSILEFRKLTGDNLETERDMQRGHLFICIYLCFVRKHFRNGSLMTQEGSSHFFTTLGSHNLCAHVIYIPARAPHLPSTCEVERRCITDCKV